MTEFVIGQKVAIYWSSTYGGNYITAIIERDTKLYWIAGGRKFRKSDSVEPGSNDGWGRVRRLLPLDDARVVSAAVEAKKSRAYGKVAEAQNHLATNRESQDAIKRLRIALNIYADTLGA